MKRHKAWEDMTHQDLFEALIYDEYIQDNMYVFNDYAEDKNGNSRITLAFESVVKGKKGDASIMVFIFDKQGRLVGIESAVRPRAKRDWNMAISDPFLGFTTRFSDDMIRPAKKKKE